MDLGVPFGLYEVPCLLVGLDLVQGAQTAQNTEVEERGLEVFLLELAFKQLVDFLGDLVQHVEFFAVDQMIQAEVLSSFERLDLLPYLVSLLHVFVLGDDRGYDERLVVGEPLFGLKDDRAYVFLGVVFLSEEETQNVILYFGLFRLCEVLPRSEIVDVRVDVVEQESLVLEVLGDGDEPHSSLEVANHQVQVHDVDQLDERVGDKFQVGNLHDQVLATLVIGDLNEAARGHV